MVSFQTLLSLLLFAIITHVRVISPQRLSSTLLEGDRACPGVQVNFTCTTSGSLIIAWRSDEYIGPNGVELEFTSADGVGSMMISSINPNTIATLVEINGNRVVESSLTIIVLDSYQTASVTCSEVGQGASTITFTLLAIPGIPQHVTADLIVSKPDLDYCAILLQWMPPSTAEASIQHYIIDSPAGRFITRDTSVQITLLIHHCNETTYIRIHAVDYCDRDGPSTNDILGLLLANTTLPPVTVSRNATDSTQCSGQQTSGNNTAIIVGVVLGSLFALTIIIALSVALGIVNNRVGHLSRDQLEYALIPKQTDTETHVASDSSSMPEELACKDKPSEKPEEMPKEHQEIGSGTESRVTSDSSSNSKDPARKVKPNKELKKPLYVVRLKHIKDISSKSLIQYEDPDGESDGDDL